MSRQPVMPESLWTECDKLVNIIMLEDLLNRAVELGAERIEIECEDRAWLVTAFQGPIGAGIEWLDQKQWETVCQDIQDLKKRKKVTLGGKPYRLRFSQYESFNEWVQVIEILPGKKRSPRERSVDRSA